MDVIEHFSGLDEFDKREIGLVEEGRKGPNLVSCFDRMRLRFYELDHLLGIENSLSNGSNDTIRHQGAKKTGNEG